MTPQPKQSTMFPTGNDLPLFSGTAPRATDETYNPQPAEQQARFDIGQRVTFGTYRQPATVKQVWPDCQIAQLESEYRSIIVCFNQIHTEGE